ncbi:MAG: GyrI-like domain-containing protein [Coriobacteriia bacterium]|nr:GyrI-like domain-containing protein [Coriobacteriia bacterium]
MFQAEIKQTEPMTVAFLSRRGPYSLIPEGFAELYGWVREYEHVPEGKPMAVFLTGPERPEDEAAWELWAPIEGGEIAFGPDERGLGVKQVEPATVASAMHTGPYETIEPTYRRLAEWAGEQGYGITGPPRELYYSDPRKTPPEEYLTEIQFPVRKRSGL